MKNILPFFTDESGKAKTALIVILVTVIILILLIVIFRNLIEEYLKDLVIKLSQPAPPIDTFSAN